MKKLGIGILSALVLLTSQTSFAVTSTTNKPQNVIKPEEATLEPITWKGDKWEYLVEHPTDVHYIDPVRFEELLDNAGQHGWELVTVTNAAHYYAFYFKRPLLPEKIAQHRDRVLKLKKARLYKAKALQDQINQALKENISEEKQYQQQIQKVNRSLNQQIREEKILGATLKQNNRNLLQSIREERQEKIITLQDDQALAKKVALEKKLDQELKQVKQDSAK